MVCEEVKKVNVLDEQMFISESLAISMSQQIDSIVSLAALLGYRVDIKKSDRRLEIKYRNCEQEEKYYTLYLFLTPGKVLSSTYLFNDMGVSFSSKDMGLLGPIERLKELL